MKDAGTHEIVLERVENRRRRHVLDQSSFFGRGAVARVEHERLSNSIPRERCSFRAPELLQNFLALLAVPVSSDGVATLPQLPHETRRLSCGRVDGAAVA